MRRIAAMLASRPRAFSVVACLAAGALTFGAFAADTKPASKPAVTAKKKPAAVTAHPAAKPAVKPPAKPVPPPPPPPVELIGMVVMPAEAFRGGPPSGQFDNEGRRAAEPRFD